MLAHSNWFIISTFMILGIKVCHCDIMGFVSCRFYFNFMSCCGVCSTLPNSLIKPPVFMIIGATKFMNFLHEMLNQRLENQPSVAQTIKKKKSPGKVLSMKPFLYKGSK